MQTIILIIRRELLAMGNGLILETELQESPSIDITLSGSRMTFIEHAANIFLSSDRIVHQVNTLQIEGPLRELSIGTGSPQGALPHPSITPHRQKQPRCLRHHRLRSLPPGRLPGPGAAAAAEGSTSGAARAGGKSSSRPFRRG